MLLYFQALGSHKRQDFAYKNIYNKSKSLNSSPIVVYSYNKAIEMHYFSALFGKELYIFRTDLPSIIRSLKTVFTVTGICHTSYVNCLLARSDSQHN